MNPTEADTNLQKLIRIADIPIKITEAHALCDMFVDYATNAAINDPETANNLSFALITLQSKLKSLDQLARSI